MAIPTGTTARQLNAIARWVLAAAVVLGVMTWWWPSYRSWAALAASLMAVWALWLVCRMVQGRSSVPGHPVYLALLGPAAVLTWHMARTGLGAEAPRPGSLAGAMNISMIFQLSLLALGIMLSQSLLPRASEHPWLLSVCGAAMMGGSAAAVRWGQADHVNSSIVLLGYSGVAVWLSALWHPHDPSAPVNLKHNRPLRLICIGLAGIAAVLLAIAGRKEAVAAAGAAGLALVLGGGVLGRRRKSMLLVGAALVTGAAALMVIHPGRLSWEVIVAGGAIGRGEEGFADVWAGDNALAVLGATIGWAGLGWLAIGVIACVIWLMTHARQGAGEDRARAVVWTAATALSTGALIARGGLFIPSVTLAAAFTWGLLPAMLGREERRRSGGIVVGCMVVLMLLMELAKDDGLLMWATAVMGGNDKTLHVISGFFGAMVLAWWMGTRSIYRGLWGVVLAIAAGAAGEFLQAGASVRNADVNDWIAGTAGSLAAVVPYLLCMGSRWCESRDAVVIKESH